MSTRSDEACAAHAQGMQEAEAQDSQPQPLPSEALLRGQRLVEIAHNGEVYRLQATRLGKLILTK